jgi:transcription elongation factor GreA
MSAEKIPMTRNGYTSLEEELKNLKSVKRPAIIEAIATARAHGDLSENAEYHAAKEQQSFIEGRIIELEAVISKAQIINPAEFTGNVVKFGATVQIVDEDTDVEETYTIVGEYEADADNGRISLTAPIARALIGKSVGDSVEIRSPKGKRSCEILKVVYQ